MKLAILLCFALIAAPAFGPAALADTIAMPPPAPAPAAAPALSVDDAKAIAAALRQGVTQGLSEPDMTGALQALAGPDERVRAAASSTLSAAAVRLAAQQHGRIADPSAIDKNFALAPPYDPQTEFGAARDAGRIAAWAAALAPTNPAYQPLVAARARYQAIVAAGGWGEIAAGKPPKLGAADARVPALRQRLGIEGFAAPAPDKPPGQPDVFDAPLAAALADFQTAHAIKADGVLTAETVAALNVPAEARLAAIDVNLERERWLPHDTPPLRVEVNIAGPDATLFRDGAPVLSMRAIVGQPTKKTPSFVSSVTAIVFNPPWVVPGDIAAGELWPKERRRPGYLARNGFYASGGQLIQRAGPKAALGYIKFDMPDPFSVYMHDTPSRSLFKRDKRWLSHGCMRLELPRELATELLTPQGWDRTRVDSAIAAGATRRTPLAVQPPVFVVYRTVTASADGRATFRPDVYGWDAKVEAALKAPSGG